MSAAAWTIVIEIPLATILVMLPGAEGSFRSEIRPVEKLGWSWKKALLGGLVTLPVGFLMVAANRSADMHTTLFLAFAIPWFCFLVGGLRNKRLGVAGRPNSGTWLSARNGAYGGAIIIGLNALSYWWWWDLEMALLTVASESLVVPCFFGWVPVLRHFLLRALLSARGALPFRLVPFLEHAANCAILRRVGGGFMFVHALLLDHLADERAP
jgi:hypothetical protein